MPTTPKSIDQKPIDQDTAKPHFPPSKPILRGRIHQIAFYKTLILTILYIITSLLRKFKVAILIYLLSQLVLYGVSSTYHLRTFRNEKTRRLFQKLDHSSIFILISGTQSSIFLMLLPTNTLAIPLLITTWSISFVGVFKVLVFSKIIEMLDVVIYITHGICVIPFFRKLAQYVGVFEWVLFVVGGLLYIVGGVVFGMEVPNPFPLVFGYHEIFHLLTVLANLCFMVPMIIKYFEIIKE